MEKPIVFLSHSSADKVQLAKLKEVLDSRAAGSLEFFLSSDGQSIRFGRNWVARISDALSKAKLMFVFLSAKSADSKWIHFEAGCAYAKDILVVPVCLPGVGLNHVTAPLNLLQGFNLHSADSMSNLARICNDEFKMRIDEKFASEDFENVFADSIIQMHGFFGDLTSIVENVTLTAKVKLLEKDFFDPSPSLEAVCKSAETGPLIKEGSFEFHGLQMDLSGCSVRVLPLNLAVENPPAKAFTIQCCLSPELFHLNAPLIDAWRATAGALKTGSVTINFRRELGLEETRQKLTTKIFNSGIRRIGTSQFDYDGLEFVIQPSHHASAISFNCSGNLNDTRLQKLVGLLFTTGVLYERPIYDYPEI